MEHPQEDILQIGEKVPDKELVGNLFQAEEGFVQMIYGRIRQGKSTEAVRRMYEALSNGRVVYSNLRLDLSPVIFDDRLQISIVGKNILFGEKRFYRFRKENFHWFNPVTGECDGRKVFDPSKKDSEIEWLNRLTDCEIYYDEGQWLLDSYESTYASVAKRKLITETGHMNRLIVIIAQRTQSVHVNARGNVNQFFRCQKVPRFLFFTALQVEEFQDMKGNDVDEDSEPVSVKTYVSNSKYWRLFDTHYLRAGKPRSQEVFFDAYDLSFQEKVQVLLYLISDWFLAKLPRLKPRELGGAPAPGPVGAARVELPPSLGVEPVDATLKSGERLNTVPAGGPRAPRTDARARARSAFFAKARAERERKDREAEMQRDQNVLPF